MSGVHCDSLEFTIYVVSVMVYNVVLTVGSYDMRYLDESQLKKREQYGPIIQEELAPGKNFVMLFDPDDIEIFYRQEGLYPERMQLDPLAEWRRERGLPGSLSSE